LETTIKEESARLNRYKEVKRAQNEREKAKREDGNFEEQHTKN